MEVTDLLSKEYKFIKIEPTIIANRWGIFNKKTGDELGLILWYNAWRKYVVQFDEYSVFSDDCLIDIVDFLKQLKERNAK